MNIKQKLVVCPLCFPLVVLASDLEQASTGFVWPLGRGDFKTGNGWWLSKDPDYFKGEYHLGIDMLADFGSNVYAIADGKVKPRSLKDWGDGNCAAVIEHKTYDGSVFTAIYGHLQCNSLVADGSEVYAGKPIGRVGKWQYGDHVHISIYAGPYASMAKNGWGRRSVTYWTTPCEGNPFCDNGFTNPIAFIQNNFAFNPSSERQTKCQGDICWEPVNVSCDQATSRYQLLNPPYAQAVGMEVCNKLQVKLEAMAANPNPREEVPENSVWQRWWRAFLDIIGGALPAQAAGEIQQFGTINIINVYTGTVVAGNASKASYGRGKGYQTIAVDSPQPNLPDFITTEVKLTTPWGLETYRYGQPEKMQMHARFENIGDGECSGTIIVHFYLSRGHKEDAHSAWKRVGTDEIQCENLRSGQTHSEEEGLELWRDIPEPGVWNIVACADHPRDDHNEGGDHPEEHESNNCSSEAVFEVTADGQVVNQANIDFVAHSLHWRQAPAYAGDLVRLGGYLRNQGIHTPLVGIRSSYSVECPGTGRVYLTDDGTEKEDLVPGADAWEETLSPVTVPNATGNCTAYFCADYQGAVSEGDESNNCTTLSFTLQPRPKPNFTITAFGLAGGKTSIKKGDKAHPAFRATNNGASCSGAFRSTYFYRYDWTGWMYLTDDHSDPLCPGQDVREEYDKGVKMTSKGNAYFRVCVDDPNQNDESNETDNCVETGAVRVK
jgi:hypothetical protein